MYKRQRLDDAPLAGASADAFLAGVLEGLVGAAGQREVRAVSLGRDGLPVLHLSDEELLGAAIEEVGHHLGLTLVPRNARVSRWPGAFPQYRPHHAEQVAQVQHSLPAGLAIAGAGYHGVGVPACIRSAGQAVAALGTHLGLMPQ